MSTPPTARFCARHPKVPTYLTCATCGTPICPDCFVQTPVGMKCRACGTLQNTALFNLTPAGCVLGASVGLALGALGGVGAHLLSGIFLFGFFLAMAYGRFAGTVVLRAAGRKLGLAAEILTGASILVGGLVAHAVIALGMSHALSSSHLPVQLNYTALLLHDPFTLLFIVIIAAAAVSRIRYAWGTWDL